MDPQAGITSRPFTCCRQVGWRCKGTFSRVDNEPMGLLVPVVQWFAADTFLIRRSLEFEVIDGGVVGRFRQGIIQVGEVRAGVL